MKLSLEPVACVLALSVLVASQLADAQPRKPQPQQQQPGQRPAAPTTRPAPMAAQQDPATLKDIEATFGFVPQFMRSVAPAYLPSFWGAMKNFELGNTTLDKKTKELIGLAVASQIPCDYCIVFHTEAARLNGATDQEIQEAVGMAAMTRQGSTLLNGMNIDEAQFKKDLDRIVRTSRQQARR